jgi:hypothetical protein
VTDVPPSTNGRPADDQPADDQPAGITPSRAGAADPGAGRSAADPSPPGLPGPPDDGPALLDDDALLRHLAAALAVTDPVPTATTEAVQALLRWRSDDADLVTLGLAEPAPVRSGSTLRVHRFTTGDLEVEVTVDDGVVAGWIEPWPPVPGADSGASTGGATEGGAGGGSGSSDAGGTITVEAADGSAPIEGPIDGYGGFEVGLHGTGPIRLTARWGSRRLRTEWILPH